MDDTLEFMRSVLVAAVLVGVLGPLVYCIFKRHESDKAVEQYMQGQNYNERRYKCATVREWADGRVKFTYHHEKGGC